MPFTHVGSLPKRFGKSLSTLSKMSWFLLECSGFNPTGKLDRVGEINIVILCNKRSTL